MKMKRVISWIICLTLIFSTVSVFAAQDTEEAGVIIVSTTPEDGSLGVTPMGTKMEVTFNVPMDPASLSKSTITSIPDCISAVVPNEKSPNRCTIYLKALDIDTKHVITFSKQVKSASGDRLNKTEVSFHTSAEYPKYHQIVNGDMEDTTHLNMFGIGNATSSAILYVKEDGNTVLKFNPQWAGAPVGQGVYLEPGKTYEMRAKIKSTTSQMVRMIMSYVTVSGGSGAWWHDIISKTLPAGEWVEYSGAVTIPTDLSYDYVREVRITAANKNEVIYIDDWQFYEAGFDVPMPKTSGAAVEKKKETFVAADVDTALETLVGIGIFDEEVLNKKDAPISRLDAAVALGKFMNAPSIGKNETKFADLAGVKNAGMVNALVEMGIISGFGKSFYPNNDIAYADVVKALSKILGYDIMLEKNGYIYTARKIGLNTGVSDTSGAISYSTFAKIILNAADAEVMVSNGNAEYSISDRKAMDLFMGIYKGKGIVSATEYSDLYGTQVAGEGKIMIDRAQYNVTCDTFGWEGKLIDYYYKIENGQKIIIHVGGLNSLSRCITIEYKDILGYSSNKYTYYNSKDRKTTVNIATDKKFIYNGKAVGSYNSEDLIPKYGTVQLIDNNLDGKYDIIRVENLETYVVRAVNYEDYKIFDEEYDGKSKSLSLDNCDRIVVEENGEVTKFENITVGSVVSAAVSMDKSFAKLYVSKNTAEGLLGKSSVSSSEITMSIIDEIHKEGVSEFFKVHPFYKGAEDARTNSGKFTGEVGTISFDHRGYAVVVKLQSGSEWKWAYLISAKSDEGLFDYDVRFNFFLEGGTWSVCKGAKVVRINGAPVKKENVYGKLNNGAAQLLRIKYNSNGEISEIITTDSNEETIKKVAESDSGKYFSTFRTFEFKVTLASTSIPVFVVPSNVKGAKDYQFVYSTASSYLTNDKAYKYEAYSIDDNALTAECIVLKDHQVKSKDSWRIGVIKEVVTEFDADGEIYKKISIQNSATNYTAKVYDERVNLDDIALADETKRRKTADDVSIPEKAEIGDVVMFQNDAQGFVDNMKLIYKADQTINKNDKGILYATNASSTLRSAYRTVAGKVVENKNGHIKVLPYGAEDNRYEVFGAEFYSKILCVDKDARDVVTTTHYTDIYDEKCGDDAVDIVIVSAWADATLMVIYR